MNNLTPAQIERYNLLTKESDKISSTIKVILENGEEKSNINENLTNKQEIITNLTDLLIFIDIFFESLGYNSEVIEITDARGCFKVKELLSSLKEEENINILTKLYETEND